jgi:hypothetical protein
MQGTLQCPPLLSEVTRAVGGDPIGEHRIDRDQCLLAEYRGDLGAAA